MPKITIRFHPAAHARKAQELVRAKDHTAANTSYQDVNDLDYPAESPLPVEK